MISSFKPKGRLCIAALMVLAAGCSHLKEGKGEGSFTIAQVGDLHNRLLAGFYTTKPSNEPIAVFQNHEALMQELGGSLIDLGGRRSEVQTAIERGNARLEQLGLLAGRTLKPEADLYGVLVSDLVARRMISTTLAGELYKIQDLAHSDRTPGSSKLLAYIDGDFANRAWSVQDRSYAMAFSSVARSSAEFWGEPANAARLKPGSSSIIADAVGALWGGLLGPVGSILYGAAFSLYDNEVLSEMRAAPLTKISLGCIPRGGKRCDMEGYGCLVMFPEARWSLMRQLHRQAPLEFDGEAEVRLSGQPTLTYKLRSAPAAKPGMIPVDSDFSLPDTVAALLGFEGITVLKGKYEIDERVGEFGSVTFNITATPRKETLR